MPTGRLESAWRHGSLVSLAAALLALAAAGCGGAGAAKESHSASSSSATTTPAAHAGGYVKLDGDEDNDDLPHPAPAEADELPLLRSYGPPASPADARAIAALVKSYYAASVAGDAARACSLLEASLATGLAAAQHSQPEDGAKPGCAKPMSLLLEQQHTRLVGEDVPTMTVVAVHVKGELGLAVLGFRTTPESQIVVAREGGTWKIAALVGTYMP